MNKTVHQSSRHRLGIQSLSFITSFADVCVISLTLEAHVCFDTRVRSEKLPPLTVQQTVFSCRKTARVTRSHKQFSTATFLLISGFPELDRVPANIFRQPFPKVVSNQFAKLLRHIRKTVETSVWHGDCNVWTSSERQSQEAGTTPSEVVLRRTNQAASRVADSVCAQQRIRREPTLLHCCSVRRASEQHFSKEATSICSCRIQALLRNQH